MSLKKKIGRLNANFLRLTRELWANWSYLIFGPTKFKEYHELKYWKKQAQKGHLKNDGYLFLFTDVFDVDTDFYRNKKLLDIGCGPRGSLEWANMASERIGLDPLADSYKKLGSENHKMNYVKAYSENIPFGDDYFDIVSSINSLDHVEDLDKTIEEICRVTSNEGYFLLIVEVNHKPTKCEPISFSWEVTEKFAPKMKLIEKRCLEDVSNGVMLTNLQKNVEYDHTNTKLRKGILVAKFKKVG